LSDASRRVLVVGAGALGTVYGACLARGGADVQLLTRRPHAEAIQAAGGVEIEGVDGHWHARLRARWRADELEPADTIILTTKDQDTVAALDALPDPSGVAVAVSFQNGVAKDRRLADWCGAERVVGAMSMVGATIARPGVVRHTLALPTYLGELPSGVSERVRALGALLEAGGLPVVLTPRVLAAEWSKLVHAAPTMTLTGLSRLPFHRVLLDPRLSEAYVGLLHEAVAIAAAGGVEVEDLPGMFPVRTLTTVPRDEAIVLVHDRGRAMEAAGSTDVRVSMLTDIEQGRPLELDAVHGFLTREAERLGVHAPLTTASYGLLAAIDAVRA
jgi:2-dehydropantoate 2-reductase